MTEEIDLEEKSEELSRRRLLTVIWISLSVLSATAAVFTLPRGVVGLFVIGAGHGASVVLTVVGVALFSLTILLLWRWSASLRAQRVIVNYLNEAVADIIEADDTGGETKQPRS